jgi:hypothetical protein
MFNFEFYYRTGNINSADGPLRRPDYITQNENNDQIILLILQRKLQSNTVKIRTEMISIFKYKIKIIRKNAHLLLNNSVKARNR